MGAMDLGFEACTSPTELGSVGAEQVGGGGEDILAELEDAALALMAQFAWAKMKDGLGGAREAKKDG